jgi:TPR repeat protein
MRARPFDVANSAGVKRPAAWLMFLATFFMFSSAPSFAQNKAACALVSKSDAESILGVTLQPPKPSAPFRSLLDSDFTSGTPEQGCEFTNIVSPRSRPSPYVHVNLEVRYAAAPNAHAVDEARKEVDTRTYDHPTDLPGLGDAAFWIGPPNNITLFVFTGGTVRLMVGPSEVGLEKEKALAEKALAALGSGKTAVTYGTQPAGLNKPVLASHGPHPSALDHLKSELTVKADRGDVKAQFALAQLYASGAVMAGGSVQHDYAGAAYWYNQAVAHGDPRAAFELAALYHDGLGVPADAEQSFQLLKKAAEANYVPAMSPLSDIYAEQKTPVSAERATDWATRAANAGDARGWLILGFEYSTGLLGGDRPFWYSSAMEAFRKSADDGNCVAMLAMEDFYTKGLGVKADKTSAQNWRTQAEKCQAGNLAMLQQQISQYRARVAAMHEPSLSPMIDAIPVSSRSAAPVARNGHNGDSRILADIAAGVAVIAALVALIPDTGPRTDDEQRAYDRNMAAIRTTTVEWPCINSGGYMDAFGSCSH